MAFTTWKHSSGYYLCQQNAALQTDDSSLDFLHCTFCDKTTSGLKYKRNDKRIYEFDSEIRGCEILMLFTTFNICRI